MSFLVYMVSSSMIRPAASVSLLSPAQITSIMLFILSNARNLSFCSEQADREKAAAGRRAEQAIRDAQQVRV